jgi:hypothetical protein
MVLGAGLTINNGILGDNLNSIRICNIVEDNESEE